MKFDLRLQPLPCNPPADYSITISLNLEAILSGIGAEHEDTDDSPNAERYNQLRELSSQDLNSQFQGFQQEFWMA